MHNVPVNSGEVHVQEDFPEVKVEFQVIVLLKFPIGIQIKFILELTPLQFSLLHFL